MVTWIHAATIFRRYFQVVTVKTEKVIASLEGHEDSVEVVSFSPTYVLGWSTFQPGNNISDMHHLMDMYQPYCCIMLCISNQTRVIPSRAGIRIW